MHPVPCAPIGGMNQDDRLQRAGERTFQTADPNLIEFLLDRGHQPIEFDEDTATFEQSDKLLSDVQEWDEMRPEFERAE